MALPEKAVLSVVHFRPNHWVLFLWIPSLLVTVKVRDYRLSRVLAFNASHDALTSKRERANCTLRVRVVVQLTTGLVLIWIGEELAALRVVLELQWRDVLHLGEDCWIVIERHETTCIRRSLDINERSPATIYTSSLTYLCFCLLNGMFSLT